MPQLINPQNNISIHALLWSATIVQKAVVEHLIFLSTHSCGVRPRSLPLPYKSIVISIHALLWSATAYLERSNAMTKSISIHALLWSATVFFSTPSLTMQISIHALLWSATFFFFVPNRILWISIHALLWSATIHDYFGLPIDVEFLFTHSCGVRRHLCIEPARSLRNFYPRTPVECDTAYKSETVTSIRISIHALLWSATNGSQQMQTHAAYFYPRTPVECDSLKGKAAMLYAQSHFFAN